MSSRAFSLRSKPTLDPHSSIEPLEARIAPAGAVLTTYDPLTGALTIAGDGEANGVKILKTGPNAYRIEGVTAEGLPTTIDGGAFQDVGKITSISFDMAGGNDAVEMVDVKKLKSLDFMGGAGNDTFEAENLTTKGLAEFDLGDGQDVVKFTGIATVIGKNLSLTANAGGSRVEFLAGSNTVHQAISLEGGDGNDGLFLGQDSALRVGRGVTFLSGSAGNDFVELDRGSVVSLGKNAADGLSLRVEGSGSDSDRVLVGGERVNLAGGIRIVGSNDAANGDQFVIGGHTESGQMAWSGNPSNLLKIGKDQDGVSVHVDGLAGDDSLSLEASSGILLGGLVYAAGDGNNEFSSVFSDKLTIGKMAGEDLLAGRSIVYTGGSGDDVVSLRATQFMNLAGFLDVTAGDGVNQLSLDAQNLLKIGKPSALGRSIRFDGGAGEDSVILNSRKITLAGYVDVSTDDGDDLLKVLSMNASFGKSENPYSISFDSGEGDDVFEVTAEKVVAAGHLMIRSGFPPELEADDHDRLTINSGSFHGAGITFAGSGGDDTLEMNVDRLTLAILDYSSLGGSDSIAIQADGHVKEVSFHFESIAPSPNPGQSQVNIAGLSEKPGALVLGRPTPPGESPADFAVSFLAEGDDGIAALTVQNVTFGNALAINTGAGVNTVKLDNIHVLGALSVVTGAEADLVEIERGPGAGPSKITKLANINLGAGDDIIRIGSTTESPLDHRVRFLGGLELLGGEGTDRMNADLTTANEITGTPTIEIEEQDA